MPSIENTRMGLRQILFPFVCIINSLEIMIAKLKSIEEHQTQAENRAKEYLEQQMPRISDSDCTRNQNSNAIISNDKMKLAKISIQLSNGQALKANQPKQPELGELDEDERVRQVLLKKMDKLYNALSWDYFEMIQGLGQIDEAQELEEVEDFIQKVHANLQNQVPRVWLILQCNARLRDFLQWIFEAAPLLFYHDLILLTCKLMLIAFASKNSYPLQAIIDLSRNIDFISHLVSDGSLKILNKVFLNLNATRYAVFMEFICQFTQVTLELSVKGHGKEDMADSAVQMVEHSTSGKASKSKKVKKQAKKQNKDKF